MDKAHLILKTYQHVCALFKQEKMINRGALVSFYNSFASPIFHFSWSAYGGTHRMVRIQKIPIQILTYLISHCVCTCVCMWKNFVCSRYFFSYVTQKLAQVLQNQFQWHRDAHDLYIIQANGIHGLEVGHYFQRILKYKIVYLYSVCMYMY